MDTNVKKELVIYHMPCADGFCSAWLLKQILPDAEFHPGIYGEPAPEIEKGRKVIIVDFSYPRDVLEKMYADSEGNLIVLDHHKTAEANLEGLPYCVFDMNKSGAMLTLGFIEKRQVYPPAPNSWLGKIGTIREFVRYIQDRDLWRFEMPDSHEVNAAIRSYPFDFEAWNDMVFKHGIEKLKEEGRGIMRYRKHVISEMASRAEEMDIDGHVVFSTQCPISELVSDVAVEIIRDRPFGVCWFDDGNKRIFSLRSKGDFDVSEVAKKFGGGGHKNAAGFFIPMETKIGF